MANLSSNFDEIIQADGLDNYYQDIDYKELSTELQDQIDSLNLTALLQDQLEAEDLDISMTRFLINRISKLKITDPIVSIMKNFEKFHSLLPELIRYLSQIEDSIDDQMRHRIGTFLLKILDNSLVGQLEFHKMQIMSLFADSNRWIDGDTLAKYNGSSEEDWYQGMFLLALGKAGKNSLLRPTATTPGCGLAKPYQFVA